MLALQAGVVAAPRETPAVERFKRLRGPAWSLVPLGSIVVVIFSIRFLSSTANFLTYLALVAVPPLAALALAWCMHGARPWLALAAVALFLVGWFSRHSLVGEGARALLSALSCVTLGVLLSAVTPPSWLKLGIVLMAGADTWLVVSDLLQAPNTALVLAHPGAGLPQLQSETFGTVNMGYGDLFVAALLGAVWASEPRIQRRAALLTFVVAALFDLLFFAVSELPATVPVAVVVVVLEAWSWSERRRGRTNIRPSV